MIAHKIRLATSAHIWAFVLGALTIVPVAGCKSNTKTSDPFDYYEPDPNTFTVDPNPDRLAFTAQGTRYPTDQLLILLTDGASPDDAQVVAQGLGGTVVGQIPAIRIYQLQFDTTTATELEALRSQASTDPSVEAVAYNLEAELNDACMPPNDNDTNLTGNQRCNFTDIQYYQSLAVFEKIRDDLALNDVKVAVVDTGLDVSIGEFADVDILNLDGPNSDLGDSPLIPHGTWVTSVIAADDNGNATNGIASRFLGRHLKLLIGGNPIWSVGFFMAKALEFVHRAAAEGQADIVNLSMSWNAIDGSSEQLWKTLFSSRSDTLFVVSAPNHPEYLENSVGVVPAGIELPNVITVGGTTRCDPKTVWSHSAYGPDIDIVAPADHITALDAGGETAEASAVSGNSFATPQVVSAAAILLSVDSTLTPGSIKTALTTWSEVASDQNGRQYPALDLYLPLANHLLTSVSISDETRQLLDADDFPGAADPVGEVVVRICGGVRLTIGTSYKHEYLEPNWVIDPEEPYAVGAMMSPSYGGWNLKTYFPDGAWMEVGCLACDFNMEDSFPMTDSGTQTDGMAVLLYWSDYPSADQPYGESLLGQFHFDNCRINERDSIANTPYRIGVQGHFEGTMEIVAPPDQTYAMSFESFFLVDFTTFCMMEPDAPYCVYLDENCDGGLL